MTWLSPMLAGVAAAVVIPSLIILYFLKLKRREIEVSTTLLWTRSIQDLQANAPFQRLRRNILLLLQLLALMLALLALAQPQWRTNASPGDRIVVLIDRSASMSAMDASDEKGEPISRLDLAKLEAMKLVEKLREPGFLGRAKRDEAMVIAFDVAAEVTQSFTADKARLRAAIESIQPGDAPSSLDEAARLAGAYVQPTLDEVRGLVAPPGAPIHLWSDGRLPDAPSVSVSAGTPVIYHATGQADTPNIAITSFRAQRAVSDPQRLSIFVGIQSTAIEPRKVDVELAIDGVINAIRSIELPAAVTSSTGVIPATGGVLFKLRRTGAAVLRARIDVDDALDIDNVAQLAIPPARRLAVLYVSNKPTFVLDALQSLELSRLTQATPDQYEQLVETGQDASYDVAVLDGWAPDGDLPAGRYLVFAAAPTIKGHSLAGAVIETGPRIVIDWARQHPALRAVSMENLFLERVVPLDPGVGGRTLAESDAGPLIVEASGGAVRAIVVGFDVMQSNWVWDYNMVLFIGSAVRHLAGESAQAMGALMQTGQTLSTRLPTGASDVTLRLPDRDEIELAPAADGRVQFGPVRHAGLYALRWRGKSAAADTSLSDGRSMRVIAANLLDADESNLGALPNLELASRDVPAASAGDDAGAIRQLWRWLLLASLAVVMFEWFIYNRKAQL